MFSTDASAVSAAPAAAITRKPATKRKPASTRVKPKVKKPAAKKAPKRPVRKVKSAKGKPGRPPRYHDADHQRMRKLYASGLTLDKVGAKMKCTGQCVRSIFIKRGWKVRPKGHR